MTYKVKSNKGHAFGLFLNVLKKIGLANNIPKKSLIAFMTKHNI